MFCDRCGAEVRSDQRFCGHCGRAFGEALAGYPRRSRVQEHIRLLAIFWMALSAFNAVGAVVLYVIANTLIVRLPDMGASAVATGWLHPFLTVISILVAAKAAVGFLVGWGLLHREPWARIVTIVMAFLALFNIPFGTVLGIYTLWVLLPAESDAEYQAHVRSAEAV